MPEPNAPNIDLGLDIKVNTLISGVPTIEEVRDAANMTQFEMQEYGVSVYSTTNGEKKTLFTKSDGLSIFKPEVPYEIKGKIKESVFIHCHPIVREERVESGRSLHILPSGHGGFEGDFAASLWSPSGGNYLNIASEYGLTMNIGVQGISRVDDLTRTLRERNRAYKLANEAVWKVYSGEKAGMSFNQDEFPQAVTDKFVINEEVLLLSHTERAIGEKYFLHLSWNKLKELEPIFGGMENLFFGDGLDKLTEHLKINVPHEKNLAKATQHSYAMPKNREG